jgi:prepilin-type N-terminal cleavage/methylation domain-containing protein
MERSGRRRLARSAAGFSLIELMMVVALMGILMAIVVLQAEAARPGLKGDGAMRVILGQMRTAQELALAQRRYIQVVFATPNQVTLLREEVPGPALTVLSTTPLEGKMEFMLSAGSDTDDGFGMASAIDFDSATSIKFAPDGTLVNQLGETIDGTVFLALPDSARSARAITVMGATGRIRGYRWDGTVWRPA